MNKNYGDDLSFLIRNKEWYERKDLSFRPYTRGERKVKRQGIEDKEMVEVLKFYKGCTVERILVMPDEKLEKDQIIAIANIELYFAEEAIELADAGIHTPGGLVDPEVLDDNKTYAWRLTNAFWQNRFFVEMEKIRDRKRVWLACKKVNCQDYHSMNLEDIE